MNLDFLTCPHCGKSIRFDDLINSEENVKHLLDIKNKIENNLRKEAEDNLKKVIAKELETTLSKEYEAKVKSAILETEARWKAENAEITKNLTSEKIKLESKLSELIKTNETNLKLALEKQATKLKQEKDEASAKLITEKQAVELKLHDLENTSESKLNLELEKVKAKLLSENQENLSKLEQELLKKANEVTTIQNELKRLQDDTDRRVKEKENALRLELVNERTAEMNTIREQFSNLLKEKEEQIKELQIANATNRIMNNKVKGENWEHEVEAALRKIELSTGDKIEKITQAGKKADFRQIVRVDQKEVATIIFECKNAEWKDTWEPKLAQDMLNEKAQYAILVATSTEEKWQTPFLISSHNRNIFITGPEGFELIALMVRKIVLIEVKAKLNGENEQDEILEKLNQWLATSFARFKTIFTKSTEGIEASEKTIRNKIGDIEKHREQLMRNWEELILSFLETL